MSKDKPTTGTKDEIVATRWSLATKPISFVDTINRMAAGLSGAGEHAEYNGHAIGMDYRPHAVSGPVWIAEYWWGGRRVMGRGHDFSAVLDQAIAAYERQGAGASLCVRTCGTAEEQGEQIAALLARGFRPSFEFLGEHRQWPEARKRELYRVLRRGTGAGQEPHNRMLEAALIRAREEDLPQIDGNTPDGVREAWAWWRAQGEKA